ALFLFVCRYVLRIWKVEPLLAPASTFLLSACFKSGVERHAAIDENRRTVDVVGIVGSQPHRGAPDVVGFANALVRNQLHQLPIRFGCAPGLHVDRRADGAGGDAVDADAMRRDLLGDALHHQHHASFTGRVVHVAGPGNHFVHGTHADDLAGGAGNFLADAATFEFADGFSRAQELASEIYVQDELPVRERHVLDPGVFLKTGVVHEDIDGAELLDHLLEHGLHLVLFADVGLVRI